MAAAKTGGKKKAPRKVRMIDGKVVKNVLYNGKPIGHGKYFAAEVDGVLLLDDAGKPMPFRATGTLQWVE